jgi:magnesium-transporting ATPase (P-type)
VLVEHRATPLWRLALKSFRNPLVHVLLLAALMSWFVGERFDPYVILGVLVLNTAIGLLLERRAEHALSALRRLMAPRARVMRDGHVVEVAAAQVVPGDVLVLQAGDRVGADARVVQAADLFVDESALTGESVPVLKQAGPLEEADLPPGERTDMVFLNTVVTGGRGTALVVATGMATEMGTIARDVATVAVSSPLEHRLAGFSRGLGATIGVVIAMVLVLGTAKGLDPATVMALGISLAVSAIPEGLPVIVSMLLAIGVWRMARRHALVRGLPAVEALGSVTVLCVDKTGTLTRNQMTVRRLHLAGRDWSVTGEGYAPRGHLVPDGPGDRAPRVLEAFASAASLCNDSLLEEVDGTWQVVGDPTEGALLVLAMKVGCRPSWVRLDEIPFSSERKWMATLHERPDGSRQGTIKGALEALLELAADELDEAGRVRPIDRERWLRAFDAMASQALRVLAIGTFTVEPHEGLESLCRDRVTLLGLAGMQDPPRSEAIGAVQACRQAGIRIVMLTGDHLATARAIARELGILSPGGRTLEGRELASAGTSLLDPWHAPLEVVARVSPAHKLQIVRALQARGEIVGMTGDGVNDAPALAQADIGVAMGRDGTEVARQAARVVLTDDRLTTLVRAVREGRAIRATLGKAVLYLVSTSAGEILLIAAAVTLDMPLPLHPVQILWINLVTDGLLDQTFAFEEPEPGLMSRPPGPPDQPLLDRAMAVRGLLFATWMAGGTLGLYAWALASDVALARARTMAFVTIVAFQWASAFTLRSFERPLLDQGPFSNRWMVLGLAIAASLQLAVLFVPPLQGVFRTVPLTGPEILLCLAMAASLLLGHEAWKTLRFRRASRNLGPTPGSPLGLS